MRLSKSDLLEVREVYRNGWDQTTDSRGILDTIPITEREFLYSVTELYQEIPINDGVGLAGWFLGNLANNYNN